MGTEAWEQGEGGAGRGMWPGQELRPPLSTWSRDRLLPERSMSPRPKAAKRMSSTQHNPGEGPGIAATGKVREERRA